MCADIGGIAGDLDTPSGSPYPQIVPNDLQPLSIATNKAEGVSQLGPPPGGPTISALGTWAPRIKIPRQKSTPVATQSSHATVYGSSALVPRDKAKNSSSPRNLTDSILIHGVSIGVS